VRYKLINAPYSKLLRLAGLAVEGRILSQTDGQTDGQMEAVASLPPFTLGPWAPPAERGPSLESIYRVSLTVDLCEGNKIISFYKFISPQPVGGPQKEKNPGALMGTCPVCPLVKTALDGGATRQPPTHANLKPILQVQFD